MTEHDHGNDAGNDDDDVGKKSLVVMAANDKSDNKKVAKRQVWISASRFHLKRKSEREMREATTHLPANANFVQQQFQARDKVTIVGKI